VCLGDVAPWWEGAAAEKSGEAHAPYPMNYYEKGAGPWTSSYAKATPKNGGAVPPHRRRKAATAAGVAAGVAAGAGAESQGGGGSPVVVAGGGCCGGSPSCAAQEPCSTGTDP
jgi:hypothetical protein